jgi:hypothetical protein
VFPAAAVQTETRFHPSSLIDPEAMTVLTGRSNSRTSRRGSGYRRKEEKKQFIKKVKNEEEGTSRRS